MITNFDHLHLYTADLDATLAFYQQTLGASPIGELPNSHGGFNHLLLLGFRFESVLPLDVETSALVWDDEMPFATKTLAMSDTFDVWNRTERQKKLPLIRRIPDTSLGNVVQVGHFPLICSEVAKRLCYNEFDEPIQRRNESFPDCFVSRIVATEFP